MNIKIILKWISLLTTLGVIYFIVGYIATYIWPRLIENPSMIYSFLIIGGLVWITPTVYRIFFD